MNKASFDYLIPDWPAPGNVASAITLRGRGCSVAPYDFFNLATHVGDNPQQVALNRQQLREQLDLQTEPLWLNQVHGVDVVNGATCDALPDADGSYCSSYNKPCVVLTADCLPVLLCNQQGTKVAAVHAGWRGLCNGIISNALSKFHKDDAVLAYLGPAISCKHFEVGSDVLEKFLACSINAEHRAKIKSAFIASNNNKYLADLYALARAELNLKGVNQVFGGNYCSYRQSEQFYSYRRDKNCGRNACLIWLKSNSL